MNKLEDLAELIERQYRNIVKSKYRPRTLEGIVTKVHLLQEYLEEYEEILESLEKNTTVEIWNRLTDAYEFVKNRVGLSLKILKGTKVFPEKKQRRRRNPDYVLEIVIPENNQVGLLEEGNPVLSSTLLDDSESEAINKSFKEDLSELKTQLLHNSFDLGEEIVDFKRERIDIKNSLLNDSNKLEEAFKRLFGENYQVWIMAFPKAEAIQCIPDYHGAKDELDAFIYQTEHFFLKNSRRGKP